jgi:cytoskeletal protein RodZ
MSKREDMRRRRQQKARQQQLTLAGGVALIAVLVAGVLIWQNLRPIGAIATAEPYTWPQANGKVLGAPEAPVTVTVYSDFQ